MTIAVFSDSHGFTQNMIKAVENLHPDAIFHLGDCVPDADALAERFPELPLYNVRGNCDAGSQEPESGLVELGGVKIFYAHGHEFNVKLRMDSFVNTVYYNSALIGLYGHTHIPVHSFVEGMHIMNPGTCGRIAPTFGIIKMDNGEIFCEIKKLFV